MKRLAACTLSALFVWGCSTWQSSDQSRSISAYQPRGNTYDYDAGPSQDAELTKLFAETPNFRAYGQEVIGGKGEKFRWKFGPMWYRGRLGQDQVKVFIIGQEGAQDENVSNRSFTGSTGTKMQKFLNHIGINKSYLFMNTFVYTITGQYSLFGEDRKNEAKLKAQKNLLKLAQHEDSIVVEHRHKMFDWVLENNKDLTLVIGVGTAGKDTAATFARHVGKGVKCQNRDVGRKGCVVNYKGRNILFIGVPHPGGASPRNGGESALKRLVTSFDTKAQQVVEAVKTGVINLKGDFKSHAKSNTRFRYGNAPVPHMDFAFGTNWRMGKSGTSSNRRGSHTIQVFSDSGCYNNVGKNAKGRCDQTIRDNIKYDDPIDLLSKQPREMAKCDIPYESPKACTDMYKEYSFGPGEKYAKLMLAWFESVDWNSLGITQHMSFGPQGFYRGDLEGSETLVIADQYAHDDMFSGRALTGEVGQKLQTQLNKEGKKYLILRTLPVDAMDLSADKRMNIVSDSSVQSGFDNLVRRVVQKNKITKIISVGSVAKTVAERINNDFKLRARVQSYSSSDVKKMPLTVIPRKDLPVHTRWWMGTSGSRAARAYRYTGGKKVYSGDYYKVYAPRWAAKARPKRMNSAEKESARKLKAVK